MINKYSNIPLYSQLKNLIIKKIDNAEFSANSKIPSEQELCELYDISRPTVRQAISELTNNGYLYKEKGKGTYVSASKSKIDIKDYSGFTDSILDSLEPGQRNIISINIVNDIDSKKLEDIFSPTSGYMQKTEYVEIKYMSTNNDTNLSLNISYIPLVIFPNIVEDIKLKKPSYDIMRGKYPLLPVKTKSSLEVIYIDHIDAQYLQIQTGQAIFKIENILYSKSGQIVEYVISKYRADKCKLLFENKK